MILKNIIIVMKFFFPALKNKYASYLLMVFSLLLTIYGTINYPGSNKSYYIFFSIISFSILFSNLANSKSYFLLYTGILLWLGLWWKATGFFTHNASLLESTGGFDFSPRSYDQSMIICSFGMLAFFSALKLFDFIKWSSVEIMRKNFEDDNIKMKINFTYCWLALYLIVFIFSALNFKLGLQQPGLPPKTILPFHLNAIVYFMLSAGFGILTSILIYLQLKFERKVDGSNLMFSMSIVTLLSCSTLSRASIIFNPLAILVAYYVNSSHLKKLSYLKKIKIVVVFTVLYIFSFMCISLLRDYYYIPAANATADPIVIMKSNGIKAEGNKIVVAFKRLLINRWVGYEGVLTSIANINNSPDLLLDLILQKPDITRPDQYLTISKSGLDLLTNNRFTPTTLPGPVGFFFLSGSLEIVVISIFTLVMIFAILEYAIFKVFNNPFLCSFFGMISAVMFVHIGLAPVNIIKFYILFGITLMGIVFIKKLLRFKFFENMIQYQS